MHSIETFLQAHSHVHIADEKRPQVFETLRALIDDGRQRLHVVADFDFTLTMYEKDGRVLPSTFGVIESNEHVTVRERDGERSDRDVLFS